MNLLSPTSPAQTARPCVHLVTRGSMLVAAFCCGAVLLTSSSAGAARRSLHYNFPTGGTSHFEFEVTRTVVTDVARLPSEAEELGSGEVLKRISAVDSRIEGRLERFVATTYRDGTLGLVSRLVDLAGTVDRGGNGMPLSFVGLDGKSLSLRLRASGEVLDSAGWSHFVGSARGGELAQEVFLQSVLRLPKQLPVSEGSSTSFTFRLPVDDGLERRLTWTVTYSAAPEAEGCGRECVAMSYQGVLREDSEDSDPARPMSRSAVGAVEGTVQLVGAGGRKQLQSHHWKLSWDRDIASFREDREVRGQLQQRVESAGRITRVVDEKDGRSRREPLAPRSVSRALSRDSLDSSGEGTDRYLAPDEVRAALHSATGELSSCFNPLQVSDGGRVDASVTFSVGRSGAAGDIRVSLANAPASNDLAGVESCLVGVVERLSLDDHDGDPLEVLYPLVYVVDGLDGRVLPYPVVLTKSQPVRLPLLELPADLSSTELRSLEWLFTEAAPPSSTLSVEN